ncbi:hypothetical protein ABZ916_39405 [Streptomyces sp. NPDC046853]|uniref:zinc finger domain-containing protein n=1 Tax=Streptomyces sp. NPDC046853 TaxID=3154920 RepID=UPI0033FB6DB6
MNRSEAALLLGHCAAFDNRTVGEADATAWASALHDMPYDNDARAAVAAFYGTAPKDPNQRLWIQPHNVRTFRTKIRNARLENFQYEPHPDETVGEYLARYKGQVQAIASGQVAGPSGRPALEGGAEGFMRELEARGLHFGDAPASAEDLVDTVRRSGPLGVECPSCLAAIGRPCKSPGVTEKQPMGKPRLSPHRARVRAASGEAELAAQERLAQEQAIKARSAQHLAREAEDIPDAEIVDEEAAS